MSMSSETESKKWRIYHKRGSTRQTAIEYPSTRPPTGPLTIMNKSSPLAHEPGLPAGELARRMLLYLYAPASVLIDEKANCA